VIRREPLVHDLGNDDALAANDQRARRLFAAVAGIALHLD
jgi:hypothetical protein